MADPPTPAHATAAASRVVAETIAETGCADVTTAANPIELINQFNKDYDESNGNVATMSPARDRAPPDEAPKQKTTATPSAVQSPSSSSPLKKR